MVSGSDPSESIDMSLTFSFDSTGNSEAVKRWGSPVLSFTHNLQKNYFIYACNIMSCPQVNLLQSMGQ